jgi:hypothetical protein
MLTLPSPIPHRTCAPADKPCFRAKAMLRQPQTRAEIRATLLNLRIGRDRSPSQWIDWPPNAKPVHPTDLRRKVVTNGREADGHLGAGGFLASQWQEVLCAFNRSSDFPQQLLQIFIAFDEIDL